MSSLRPLASILVVLTLGACGSRAASTESASASSSSGAETPAPGTPIAFTSTPDVAAAGTGPITGSLFGTDATVHLAFATIGGSWTMNFDSVPDTGYATGALMIEGTLAVGTTSQSTDAQIPGYVCDADGANHNQSQVSYALQITGGSITACPAGITEETSIGTISGRAVILAHDLEGGSPDSWLSGSFTDAPVVCIPAS